MGVGAGMTKLPNRADILGRVSALEKEQRALRSGARKARPSTRFAGLPTPPPPPDSHATMYFVATEYLSGSFVSDALGGPVRQFGGFGENGGLTFKIPDDLSTIQFASGAPSTLGTIIGISADRPAPSSTVSPDRAKDTRSWEGAVDGADGRYCVAVFPSGIAWPSVSFPIAVFSGVDSGGNGVEIQIESLSSGPLAGKKILVMSLDGRFAGPDITAVTFNNIVESEASQTLVDLTMENWEQSRIEGLWTQNHPLATGVNFNLDYNLPSRSGGDLDWGYTIVGAARRGVLEDQEFNVTLKEWDPHGVTMTNTTYTHPDPHTATRLGVASFDTGTDSHGDPLNFAPAADVTMGSVQYHANADPTYAGPWGVQLVTLNHTTGVLDLAPLSLMFGATGFEPVGSAVWAPQVPETDWTAA